MSENDFEVNKTGTHRLMMLHAMTLRCALEVIDLLCLEVEGEEQAQKVTQDGQRALETLELLRAELGPEYQSSCASQFNGVVSK